MRTIAVTGGRGFIGRRLIERHLALGDRVRALVRNAAGLLWSHSVEIFHADLMSSEPDQLRRFAFGADILYHCAAEHQDASRMAAVNIEGTRKLLLAAAGCTGRWIQLSSLGVYGPKRSGIVSEEDTPAPVGAYETSKLTADQMVVGELKGTGTQWSILRPGIVFGREMPNESVRAFLRAIRNGSFVFIGAPGALLPYVHVDDVVAALLLCGDKNEASGEIFNLTENCTVDEFVVEAARLFGVAPPTLRLPELLVRMVAKTFSWVPGFPLSGARINALTRRVCYPSDKLVQRLGFRYTTGWRNGLREMVAAV